jgi:hypothetical protein
MAMEGWDEVRPAPRQQRPGNIMTARQLCLELVHAVVALCLQNRMITVAAVKEARPLLARLYTRRFSTIPSYLGAGRAGDGLGLHRAAGRDAPRSPSRENGILALRWLEASGHDAEAFAREHGFGDYQALCQAVDRLPPHRRFEPPAGATDAPPGGAGPEGGGRDDVEGAQDAAVDEGDGWEEEGPLHEVEVDAEDVLR